MEKDNVYVLFEEIKNKIEMINGKLEQKPGTPTDGQAEEVIPTCVRHIHRCHIIISNQKNKTIGFVDAASLGFCQGYVFV